MNRKRRPPQFGRLLCPRCGESITTNALGRASHERKCSGDKTRQSIAGGRWRSGPHKPHDRQADKIDGYDRDDLGLSPDY